MVASSSEAHQRRDVTGRASSRPVYAICAFSVARIQTAIHSGTAGFSVGTAALDGTVPTPRSELTQQLLEIQMPMAKAV
ncbi:MULTISPECIES: hypothetical protein [unclassified Ensifer]|uniref:hypothetical protein n=1 Tax=unclassified Ensifer TaxID=2633371 RepID=UPI0012E32FCD|nr:MULTISPECIES: hypothetical protein [unclassified Ensifer]